MKTILWLDDIRDPEIEDAKNFISYLIWEFFDDDSTDIVWVKTQTEFENYIKENGLPDLISFDNDLGIGNGAGYDCAKWLVEYCMNNNVQLPEWYVHSSNPVAKENISKLFENFEKYFKMEEKITAWIAKDKNETVCVFLDKPEKGQSSWYNRPNGEFATINESYADLFSEVKWEDKEPTKVELTIKICR